MGFDPFAPDFWTHFQRYMQDTFDNAHKLMHNTISPLAAQTGTRSYDPLENMKAINYHHNPEIRVEDSQIIVTLKSDQRLTQENTRIFLEGNYLIVEGVIHIKIPLPTAVNKYGGRAVFSQNILRIILLRDKFSTRQTIPLENK